MTSTLPRPGSIVTARSTPPPRTVPTDTGQWFATGLTDRGPANRPVLLQSLQDFIQAFGARQTYSVLYDAVESFFREGGSRLWLGRVVGPAAVIAFKNLVDGVAATSLIVKAKGPGAYGNTITVQAQVPGAGGAGAGSYSLAIVDSGYPGGSYTEQSPDFTTQAQAVAWSATSLLVDITAGASALIPVAAGASALATGTDDRTNVVDLQWRNALALFTRDLGPGQVSQVGRTTSQSYIDTLLHASLNNRTAILDAPDTPTAATITAAAIALRTGASSSTVRYGAMFGPWVTIPGVVPGTTRNVPPCAFVCGRVAGNESGGTSPNVPAAGVGEGTLRSAIGLSQPAYDTGSGPDVTRDAMYTAGVNQLVYRYGSYQVFGWRSLVDPVGADQDWLNLGNVRLAMYIVAMALRIAESYILDEIDGRGRTFKAFEGDLRGFMGDLYSRGSLYDGGSGKPEDAYSVDTGPQVNTPATVANRELHAVIAARMTQDAELVVIEFTKVPVNIAL